MTKLTRRAMLGSMATAALAGGACLAGVAGMQTRAVAAPAAFPWVYHKLDPMAVAEPAYWGYYNGGKGCSYGSFAAIVGALAEKYGAPYDSFPMDMMVVGKSGVAGWGTICGALLGGASAIALFHERKEHTPLIDELFRWYESAALPNYAPPKPKVEGQCKKLEPGSVLCHVSASRWSYDTKCDMHDPERSERCARITGEVAMKTVEILNAAQDKTFVFSGFSAEAKACKECHGKKKESDHAKGKMDCMACHDDLGKDHPQ